MSEKIYAGSGKVINGKYGAFDALNLDVDTLLEHAYKGKNGRRYINVNISDRREADKFGNTKNVVVNKPPQATEVKSNQHSPDRETADLPF